MIPSVKLLSRYFDRDQAKRIRRIMEIPTVADSYESVQRWVSQCYNPPRWIERAMRALNEEMHGFGVECIKGEYIDKFWDDVIATYVNMGDTYNTTILFDTRTDLFKVTSHGDWVESYEKKGGKIN